MVWQTVAGGITSPTWGHPVDVELSTLSAAEFADAVLTELRVRGYAAAGFDQPGFVVHPMTGAAAGRPAVPAVQDLLRDARPGRHRGLRLSDAALRLPPSSGPRRSALLRSVLRLTSFTAAVTGPAMTGRGSVVGPFVHELAVLDTGAARGDRGRHRALGVTGEQMFAVARGNIAARYPPAAAAVGSVRVRHLRGDGQELLRFGGSIWCPAGLSSFAGTHGESRRWCSFPVTRCCWSAPTTPTWRRVLRRRRADRTGRPRCRSRRRATPSSVMNIVGYDVGVTACVRCARWPSARVRCSRRPSSAQTGRLQRYFAEQGWTPRSARFS